jgi:SanA protein
MPVRLKSISRKVLWIALGMMLLTGALNLWIVLSSRSQVFATLDDLPPNQIGLLLGARPGYRGRPSPFFQGRIEAAARLYHAGKVKHLLVSGDRRVDDYDEPGAMKRALLKSGVPESAMTLDDASSRTLDSIVFGSVAQFRRPGPSKMAVSNRVREWLARVKAVLDIYLLHPRPSMAGPKIEIKV